MRMLSRALRKKAAEYRIKEAFGLKLEPSKVLYYTRVRARPTSPPALPQNSKVSGQSLEFDVRYLISSFSQGL